MTDLRYDIESGVTLTFENDRRGLVWVFLETAAGKVLAFTPHAAHSLARLIQHHCPPPEGWDD
jgi:hypothetical protein